VVASYKLSQTDIWFGTNAAVNLIESLDSTFALNGDVDIDRRRIIGDSGIGMTADGINAGMNLTIACRYTADVKAAITARTGWLVIRRRDANFAYGMQAILNARPVTSEVDGAVLASLGFQQGAGAGLVAAAVDATVGSKTVSAGNEGFIVDASGGRITHVISGSSSGDRTVRSGGFAVVGAPLVAEG